jgi:deoxycitidine kinase
MKVISIEGNIGAGKTTLITAIEKIADKSFCVLREPVHLWEKVRDPHTDETILEKFYRDSKTYAFPFQVMAFQTRLQEFRRVLSENRDCKVLFCERSLEADANIFAKMLHDDGFIEPICYDIYKQMYESAIAEFSVDQFVYMRVDPQICSERIVMRGRQGEEAIPLEYLEKCHTYHSEWMNTENNVVALSEREASELLADPELLQKWVDCMIDTV